MNYREREIIRQEIEGAEHALARMKYDLKNEDDRTLLITNENLKNAYEKIKETLLAMDIECERCHLPLEPCLYTGAQGCPLQESS